MSQKQQRQFEVPQALQAKVNHWKAQFGKVKYLDIDAEVKITEGKDKKDQVKYIPGKVVFFRQPTRQEMSAAEALSMNESGEVDSYKKAEKLMVDCYLGGELTLENITTDIEYYMAVANFCLYNLVEAKNVNWGNC
ncbi:MAG: hypothetical protein N4A74_21440 [Carboxylicivirga sp.]|jgi:hypothetical protein|nr:hypothetical protein [Carboxylicivirga sp.]